MKIAIFENEYDSIRGAFEVANLVSFNGELEIKVFPSSQSADFSTFDMYSAIFIDIDLSSKSDLDGFGVINKINDLNKNLVKRIVILTGNNRIAESLKERNIQNNNMQIVIKPTDYEEVTKSIKKANS